MKPDRVILEVSHETGSSVVDLLGNHRPEPLVTHRILAVKLCREFCGMSYVNAAKFFGKKNHTSTLHALRAADARIETEPRAWRIYESVRQRLLEANAA